MAVRQAGVYYVTIEDSFGRKAATENIEVKYEGEYPLVTVNPVGGEVPYSANGSYSYTLRCEGFVREGDEISYTWQRQTDNGWVNVGSGRTLTLTQEHAFGNTYRCVVTDDTTEMSTESETADVYITPTCIRAEQIGTSRMLLAEFVGGSRIFYNNMLLYWRYHGVENEWKPFAYPEYYYYRVQLVGSDSHYYFRMFNVDRYFHLKGEKTPLDFKLIIDNEYVYLETPIITTTW